LNVFGAALAGFPGILNLRLHQRSLFLNRTESAYGGADAKIADYHQYAGERSDRNCRTDRPSINERFVIVISLVFGGFFWALYVSFRIYDKRRVLRASPAWLGLGLAEGGILFLIATGFFPYTWGLPPQWLPEKWKTCRQSQGQSNFPHGEGVTQKLDTCGSVQIIKTIAKSSRFSDGISQKYTELRFPSLSKSIVIL
jgi:hypothetical protein